MKVAHRFSKLVNGKPGPYHGLTVLGKQGVRWSGEARFIPEALAEPLSWRKPQRVFVNSMSDLFHEDVTNEQIAAVWATMILGHWHTYQVLTKRADRALAVLADPSFYALVLKAANELRANRPALTQVGVSDPTKHPARNIWLGVSAEDQQRADERIPLLLKCPAAVRFVSAEPLLGPIDFKGQLGEIVTCSACERLDGLCGDHLYRGGWERGLDWVIVGGESGPGARQCDIPWIRSIVQQCREAHARCFVKQLGARPWATDAEDDPRHMKDRKGGDPSEWSRDLRVREFPKAVAP